MNAFLTGGADLMADTMLAISQPFGPVAIVAGFFLLAFLLTELISNNATAALLAPVAINAAQTFAANPRPLLVAETLAASFSFLNPDRLPDQPPRLWAGPVPLQRLRARGGAPVGHRVGRGRGEAVAAPCGSREASLRSGNAGSDQIVGAIGVGPVDAALRGSWWGSCRGSRRWQPAPAGRSARAVARPGGRSGREDQHLVEHGGRGPVGVRRRAVRK